MDYHSLRKTYPQFIYQDYDIAYGENTLTVVYHFHIPSLCSFAPQWVFPMTRSLSAAERERVEVMVFSLGMTEMISYWKAVCSPNLLLRCGGLDSQQISWWKNLMFHGLGEFYHLNHIPRALEDMPNFVCDNAPFSALSPENEEERDGRGFGGALIPIGGGKDSLVTLTHAPDTDARCFFVNPKPSALLGAAKAGYGAERHLVARRTLDSRIISLNQQGFLNGHTPFSAVLGFASVLCAYLNGLSRVVLSNEQSANEPTDPHGANHQYSKSYAFEQDFSAYIGKYLTNRVEYFSFLRPISELQIAALFARERRFHPLFRSCNRGSREDIWCGGCPKCLFVYIILSPFLSPAALSDIFGGNLWENEELSRDFDALTGKTPTKPFECVGSRDEVNAALHLCLQRHYNDGQRPLLLQRYIDNGGYDPGADTAAPYRSFYSENHQLPPAYDKALRKALQGLL